MTFKLAKDRPAPYSRIPVRPSCQLIQNLVLQMRMHIGLSCAAVVRRKIQRVNQHNMVCRCGVSATLTQSRQTPLRTYAHTLQAAAKPSADTGNPTENKRGLSSSQTVRHKETGLSSEAAVMLCVLAINFLLCVHLGTTSDLCASSPCPTRCSCVCSTSIPYEWDAADKREGLTFIDRRFRVSSWKLMRAMRGVQSEKSSERFLYL